MSFARNVHFTVKQGKAEDFRRLMKTEVHPLLKSQKGFREDVTLQQADGVVSISIWDDRASADTYNDKVYPDVLKKLDTVVVGAPTVETYDFVLSSAAPNAPRA